MAEQSPFLSEENSTVLGETNVTPAGVTQGYTQEQIEQINQESLVYEKRAMDTIKTPQAPVDWEGFYQEEFEAQDPSFLKAAWQALAPNVAKVVPNVGKAIGAGVPGAPADLAVMGYHTMRWLGSKAGAIDAGDYGFIKDMPDFKSIPGTSDYIADKFFDADTDSMEFAFGSLLTPDPASIATVGKLAGVFGGPIAFARQVQTAGKTDPQAAQNMLANFKQARDMHKAGEPTSAVYKDTGWFNTGDGWRFIIDPVNATFKQDLIEQNIVKHIEHMSTQVDELLPGIVGYAGGQATMKLGDIYDHPGFFEAYPALKDFKMSFALKNVTRESNQQGLLFQVGDQVYSMQGDFLETAQWGAGFGAGPTVEKSTLRVFGSASGSWERVEEMIVHEVEHFVQGIEGLSRGGNPEEFELLAPVVRVQALSVWEDIYQLSKKGEVDIDSFSDIGMTIMERHGPYLDTLPDESMWDELALAVQKDLRNMRDDPGMEAAITKEWSDTYDNFVQFAKMYLQQDEIEESMVKTLANTLDQEVVQSISMDLYWRLKGEGMSRLAEAIWANRKKIDFSEFDPEKNLLRQLQNSPTGSEPFRGDMTDFIDKPQDIGPQKLPSIKD